jgi:calcium/calmodulin-dependent protein kinase (CaM kinase) II
MESATLDPKAHLLDLNKKLLDSITAGNWEVYSSLCDKTLSCFEPEAQGHLVEGMDFHKFYFDRPKGGNEIQPNTTMSNPHVRLMGSVAIISYVRLS